MNHKFQTENKQHREEANVKRRSAILLAAAMMAASVPALAETMRIGDQAVVKKCKEYILSLIHIFHFQHVYAAGGELWRDGDGRGYAG